MKTPDLKYALISIVSMMLLMMIVLSCSQVESELSNKNNQLELELGIKECIRDFNQKQDSKFPPPPAPTLCDCIQGVIDENNK